MKKLAAILLALILTLACTAALAETTDQPILFRGIPWGISYEELSGQVALTGLEESFVTLSTKYLIERNDDEDPYSGTYFTVYADYTDEGEDAIGDVAGYELCYARLFFARTLDGDGNVAKDEAHTALYGATYEVYAQPVDPAVEKTPSQALEDLRAKLTSLYGEPEITGKRSVWRGAEGTLLSLFPDGNSSNYIHIYYASETGDVLLDACLAAETAVEDAFAANTNGL